MTSKQVTRKSQRQRLVHAAMDAYLDWRDECATVSDAYRRWADAREVDAEPAWHAYEAALDREEHASVVYAHLIRHVGELGGANLTLVMSGEGHR
jgi:hypothetical protein